MELLATVLCAFIIGLGIGAFCLVATVVWYSLFKKDFEKDEEENDKSNSDISDTEKIRFKEV